MATRKFSRIAVQNACKAYLRARKDRITAEREEMIKYETSRKRLFGLLKPHTREEAIEYLKGDGMWSDWAMLELRGGFKTSRVLDLQTLCEANNGVDEIILNEKDTDALEGFL